MRKRFNMVLVVIAVIILGIAFLTSKNSPASGPHTEYKCDVQSLNFSTRINIEKEGEDFAYVKGNLFRIVTDPLTMYDVDDNELAHAGDDYHFIAQDSHAITVDGVVTAEMVGLVDIFGESYDIYNSDGEMIAEVSFNMFNTNGEMYDMDGNLVADFNSKLFFFFFNIRIYEDCQIDEKTVLMIFSSYYSDQKYDISN